MKHIYLWRHAKSDWSDPARADFERPLAPRGRKAAPRMAKAMTKLGIEPELVLVSAARRTLDSWALAAPQFPDAEVRVRRGLYLAPPGRLLKTLRRLPKRVGTVMLVGHNPGLQGLALRLARPQVNAAARTRLADKFPTAALAVLSFDGKRWRDLDEGKARLERLLTPRDL